MGFESEIWTTFEYDVLEVNGNGMESESSLSIERGLIYMTTGPKLTDITEMKK